MVNKGVHSPIKFKWLSHLDLIYLEFFPSLSPPNFEVQFSRSITSHTFCWLPITRQRRVQTGTNKVRERELSVLSMSNRNIGPHCFEELLLNLTLVVDVLDSLTQAPVSATAPRVGVLLLNN